MGCISFGQKDTEAPAIRRNSPGGAFGDKDCLSLSAYSSRGTSSGGLCLMGLPPLALWLALCLQPGRGLGA